ncbi:MAG: hypothetical protein PUP92_33200 [Rhizonema sp. PD38]|nr:hypothetical protein [Rhizonema sp. PD38]
MSIPRLTCQVSQAFNVQQIQVQLPSMEISVNQKVFPRRAIRMAAVAKGIAKHFVALDTFIPQSYNQ